MGAMDEQFYFNFLYLFFIKRYDKQFYLFLFSKVDINFQNLWKHQNNIFTIFLKIGFVYLKVELQAHPKGVEEHDKLDFFLLHYRSPKIVAQQSKNRSKSKLING